MAVNTNWSKATINPQEALISLISCLEAGKNAWIELRKNGEQDFPIKIPNPELDNPFNWTMNYGIVRNRKLMEQAHYLNDTEKDLTFNWTCAYGTEDAIREYQNYSTISSAMFTGGIAHPVRIEDANHYRKHIIGDNYDYHGWTTFWKPKDNIPYHVVDENLGDVFTICYDDRTVNKIFSLQKASDFLSAYALSLEQDNKSK